MSASSTAVKDEPEVDEAPEVDEPEVKVDLEAILPEAKSYTVAGYKVEIQRLKSREFLMLMRIITAAFGGSMSMIRVNTSDPEAMQEDLLALFMLAVPNAIEEVGDFLKSIVQAREPGEKAAVAQAMINPDIDVMLDVLGLMIEQEKDDLQVLAGKAQAWITRIQRTLNRPTG